MIKVWLQWQKDFDSKPEVPTLEECYGGPVDGPVPEKWESMLPQEKEFILGKYGSFLSYAQELVALAENRKETFEKEWNFISCRACASVNEKIVQSPWIEGIPTYSTDDHMEMVEQEATRSIHEILIKEHGVSPYDL